MAGTLSIAARNVGRHKKRTFLTVITMAVGIGFFIWVDSIMAGLDSSAVQSMADYSESSLRVESAAYAERRLSVPLADGIADPQAALKAISAIAGVLGAAPRTPFQAQLSGPRGDVPVQAAVIDPVLDPKVFKLKEHTQGAWLSPAPGADAEAEILLGASLADELGTAVGQYVTLFAKSRYEANRAMEFKVVGLVNSPDPNLNSGAAYISYPQANAFLDLEGLVTQLRARVRDPGGMRAYLRQGDRVRDAARLALPGDQASSLDDLSASFLRIAATKRTFSSVIILILLFISAIGIVNTILMSIYARIKEIGVLGAFGMRRREITRLFLTEGLIIGLLGSAGGALLGFLLDLQAVYGGMPLDKLAGKIDTAGIPVWGTLYGEWNPASIAFGFLFGLAVALIASWIPARRAGAMSITRALRAN
jgi:ABC-type lipoprotein release transport system permease subunit